jgi:hypothetical protein
LKVTASKFLICRWATNLHPNTFKWELCVYFIGGLCINNFCCSYWIACCWGQSFKCIFFVLKYEELFYKRSPLGSVYTCCQRRLLILSVFIALFNKHARYICYNPTWVICAWSYRMKKKNVNFSQFVLHVSELYKYIVFFFKDCLQK